MLILTRKPKQSFVIGKEANICIRILESNKEAVKLGIHAPKEIPVHREEVYLRILHQQQETKEQQHKDTVQ